MTLEEKIKEVKQEWLKTFFPNHPEEEVLADGLLTRRLWDFTENQITICQEAVDEACKKQREICADATIKSWVGLLNDDFYNAVKNAPSPKEKLWEN